MLYHYKIEILRVVDGDTVDVLIDLGFKTYKKERIRLSEINASEMNSKDEGERTQAQLAKEFLSKILPLGLKCFMTSISYDRYGRIVGNIFHDPKKPESTVSKVLLEQKLVKTY